MGIATRDIIVVIGSVRRRLAINRIIKEIYTIFNLTKSHFFIKSNTDWGGVSEFTSTTKMWKIYRPGTPDARGAPYHKRVRGQLGYAARRFCNFSNFFTTFFESEHCRDPIDFVESYKYQNYSETFCGWRFLTFLQSLCCKFYTALFELGLTLRLLSWSDNVKTELGRWYVLYGDVIGEILYMSILSNI